MKCNHLPSINHLDTFKSDRPNFFDRIINPHLAKIIAAKLLRFS
jgi:hypothetical protein